MSELRVHPATLRTGASGLKSAADRLDGEWQALVSTVAGMGAPWGNDDIGMLIGESYLAIEQVADESFVSAVEDLRAFADGLIAMADTYDTAEEEATAASTSVPV